MMKQMGKSRWKFWKKVEVRGVHLIFKFARSNGIGILDVQGRGDGRRQKPPSPLKSTLGRLSSEARNSPYLNLKF
jgi:hypothetical protein